MSIPQQGNKENFRLLDLSSDEQSEDLQLEIIPSRKRKITRRGRSRSSAPQTPIPDVGTEVRCALLWAVRGTLVLWLLMLTWICASLYEQVSSMSTDFKKVSRSSDSVDDALQCCHAAAKDLKTNVSALTARLVLLESNYQMLAKRVDTANKEFSELAVAAPGLVQTSQKLETLETTVGNIGSQINGLEQDVKTSKKQVSDAVAGMGDVKTLLERLEIKSNETIANISADTTREAELVKQIVALNTTLVGKVEALERRLNEFTKPATTIAPSAVSTTITGLSSSNHTTASNTTSTPLSTQGPHAKPSVLHTEATN